MPAYWYTSPRSKYHRRGGCNFIRKAGDRAQRMHLKNPAPRDRLCAHCFPDDEVKALLQEMGEAYRLDEDSEREAIARSWEQLQRGEE